MSDSAPGESPELAALRNSRPVVEPEPPRLVPPPMYPATMRFTERVHRWGLEANRWAEWRDAWEDAAGQYRDRPAPTDAWQRAWQWEADDRLLTLVEPLLCLATLPDLAEWEQTGRWLLKKYVTGEMRVFPARFLLLDRPPDEPAAGVTPAAAGITAVDAATVSREWVAAHVRDDFGWEAFAMAFRFLADDRPLTPEERGLVGRLAVRFELPPPGGPVVADLVQSAVGKAWDGMRALLHLAPLPPRPIVPDPPTGPAVDQAFDLVANWLHAAGRHLAEEARRLAPVEPVPVRVAGPVDVNLANHEQVADSLWRRARGGVRWVMRAFRKAQPPAWRAEYADLLAALDKGSVAGSDRKAAEFVCEHGGEKTLADFGVHMVWDNPKENWNSCRGRLNGKVRKAGWEFYTSDAKPKVRRLPASDRK